MVMLAVICEPSTVLAEMSACPGLRASTKPSSLTVATMGLEVAHVTRCRVVLAGVKRGVSTAVMLGLRVVAVALSSRPSANTVSVGSVKCSSRKLSKMHQLE